MNNTREVYIDLSPLYTWNTPPDDSTYNGTTSPWQGWRENDTEIMPGAMYNISHVGEILKSVVNALNHYAAPVICVLGIFGDVTSFLVFVFSSFRYQPCSQYLAALTFVDTMFLSSLLMTHGMASFPQLGLAPGYCTVMVYMSYVCSFLSAWFVVFMMMERYIVICHPFRASAICNRRKSIALITVLTILSLILYSHSIFTTSQSRDCGISDEYFHFMTIFTYVDFVFAFLIPFLALLWLNLRIIFTVKKFRQQHSMLNQSIRRTQRFYNADKTLSLAQVRSTKMLVWVSSVFIVLYLPSYAAKLHYLILKEVKGDNMDASTQFGMQITQQLCQFLYNVNFAIDFVVYVMTSHNFRRNVSRCLRNIHTNKLKCQHRYQY